MDAHGRAFTAVQMQANNFRVVKIRPISKPIMKVASPLDSSDFGGYSHIWLLRGYTLVVDTSDYTHHGFGTTYYLADRTGCHKLPSYRRARSARDKGDRHEEDYHHDAKSYQKNASAEIHSAQVPESQGNL